MKPTSDAIITVGPAQSVGGGYAHPDAPHAEHQPSPFALVHKLLRGRYLWVLTSALVLGAVGGSLGYFLPTPQYRAEGLIQVKPVLPKILYSNEQSSLQPMFSSFVATQASLLQHSRVVSKAFGSEAWRELGRPRGPEAEAAFRAGLRVITQRDAPELIFVTYTDPNARAAMIAVKEIVAAYREIFSGAEAQGTRDLTVSTLTQRRTSLENDRRNLERQLLTNSAEFESSDLDRLHTHYLDQLLQLDDKVAQIQTKLLELNVDPLTYKAPDPASTPGEANPTPTPVERTPEEIARLDKTMAELFKQRFDAEQMLARLRGRGLGEKSPAVLRAQGDLDGVRATIDAYARQWNTAQSLPPITGATAIASERPVETIPEMVSRFKLLRQQVDRWRQRTELLSRKRLENESLRREITGTQALIDEVERRLDQINVEAKVQDQIGRIDTILPEAPPPMPNADPRLRFAAIGTVLGLGIPLSIGLFLGLLDRRVRFSDQADQSALAAPLLGILPHLPERPDDPEEVASAVHCVHQIRTLLQLHAHGKVYVITSPTAGDGKTSLVMSLGLSFAATGRRTVLVDFDLIGQGLTARFKLSRDRGLGHALLARSGPEILPAGMPDLFIIPSGRDDAAIVGRLPTDSIDPVLDQLRRDFDIVLVDTGPVLGSLEANAAVARADGVVLVIGRGQRQELIKTAAKHIRSLSARLVGLVFNRASYSDFNRSASSTSFRSLDARRAVRPAPAGANGTTAGLAVQDPLARLVAMDTHP